MSLLMTTQFISLQCDVYILKFLNNFLCIKTKLLEIAVIKKIISVLVLHPLLQKARKLSTQCGGITGHHPAHCSEVGNKIEGEGHAKSKSRWIL